MSGAHTKVFIVEFLACSVFMCCWLIIRHVNIEGEYTNLQSFLKPMLVGIVFLAAEATTATVTASNLNGAV